jgi:hypothetical protein
MRTSAQESGHDLPNMMQGASPTSSNPTKKKTPTTNVKIPRAKFPMLHLRIRSTKRLIAYAAPKADRTTIESAKAGCPQIMLQTAKATTLRINAILWITTGLCLTE